MGFQLNATPGAQVEINGAVTAVPSPDLPTGATRIQKGFSLTTTTNVQDVYVVTAGKDLYITSITYGAAGTMQFKIGEKAGMTNSFASGTTEDDILWLILLTSGGSMTLNLSVPLKVTGTLSICGNVAGSTGFSIVGYEV